MENLFFEGQLNTNKGEVNAKLEMYMFVEDGAYIVYCPALDLSAYGDTEEEARKAFEKTFEMHFSYCLNKKTLFDDLKKHGWIIKSKKKCRVKAPSFDDMLRNNNSFRDIVHNKDYQKFSKDIEIPAMA